MVRIRLGDDDKWFLLSGAIFSLIGVVFTSILANVGLSAKMKLALAYVGGGISFLLSLFLGAIVLAAYEESKSRREASEGVCDDN